MQGSLSSFIEEHMKEPSQEKKSGIEVFLYLCLLRNHIIIANTHAHCISIINE